MLRERSADAFAISVSSGAASSRCLLGRRRRLSRFHDSAGWTAATACSPVRLLPPGRTPVGDKCRGEAHLQQEEVRPRHAASSDVLHWLPVPFRIGYKLCLLVFLLFIS